MTKELTAQEETQPEREISLTPMGSGSAMFSLVPKDLAEAMQLATLISDSDLAPKDFKGKPGNTLIAVQMGAEIGITPMQAIQNIAVINGKPSIYGDMGKALLLKKACRIEERDIKEIEQNGEAWCKITRPDGSPPTIRTYSIKNAKDAGLWGKQGPWTTNPWRQMAWRAFWFAARDGAADMLRGLAGAEEVQDYAEIPAETRSTIREPQRKSETAAAPTETTQPQSETQAAPAETEASADLQGAPNAPSEWKRMTSKKKGKCEQCDEWMDIGTDIYWDSKAGRAYHAVHFKNA